MSSSDRFGMLAARLPRGLADRGPAEIAATRRVIERIRQIYELYGFEPVETPVIEYADALGKFLPDQDRPNEGVFSFRDDDGQWLALRYDLTAPLARFVAENFDSLPKPYRSYRVGSVFRNEKPGPGRFREFVQFDADTVGSASPVADAEICMMAADTMEQLGIPRGSYLVKLWSRTVPAATMDATLELQGRSAERDLLVLRSFDKFDRLGAKGVQQLLGEGRRDESGDFTKGAGLSAATNNFLTSTLTTAPITVDYSSSQLLSETVIREIDSRERPPFDSDVYLHKVAAYRRAIAPHETAVPEPVKAALSELDQVYEAIIAAGYSDRVKIDPSVVRGLEYYTGPVYEVDLTFGITDDRGRAVRFGAVAGGGRYDGLLARFRGQPVPATGFSIGVSRLMAALTHFGRIETGPELGPVVVAVLDRDRIADYQRMAARLRAAGIRSEVYLGASGVRAQMKYADRRHSPCVVIQGSEEMARGEVQIKDLIEGAKAATAIASNQEWRETRPAQFAVAEDQLVDAIRNVLLRHHTA